MRHDLETLKEKGKTRERQTWYGLKATVALGPGFLHRVGFGKLLIPHPPLVNWLLRRGLENNKGDILSFAHEFGHLQTAPFALLYFGVIFRQGLDKGHLYHKAYRGTSKTPRTAFWVLTSALAASGWLIAEAWQSPAITCVSPE